MNPIDSAIFLIIGWIYFHVFFARDYFRSKREARLAEVRSRLTAAVNNVNNAIDFEGQARALCKKVFFDESYVLKQFLAAHKTNSRDLNGDLVNMGIGLTHFSGVVFPKMANLEALERVSIYFRLYYLFMWEIVCLADKIFYQKLSPECFRNTLMDCYLNLKERSVGKVDDDVFIFDWYSQTLASLLMTEKGPVQEQITSLSMIAHEFHAFYQTRSNDSLHTMVRKEGRVVLNGAGTPTEKMKDILTWSMRWDPVLNEKMIALIDDIIIKI
jgi:hypothetical protein